MRLCVQTGNICAFDAVTKENIEEAPPQRLSGQGGAQLTFGIRRGATDVVAAGSRGLRGNGPQDDTGCHRVKTAI